MATVKRAYRFALAPSPAQERRLRSHAGAARFAWNWGLARCRERYRAERKWYSAAELHRLWNAEKKASPALGWWAENSKCCYQEAFRNLERALGDFVKSRKGLRKGKKLGFPRRKKKGKARDSFRLTGTIRCAGASLTLPRLGTVRTHEDTGKLASRVEAGTARITVGDGQPDRAALVRLLHRRGTTRPPGASRPARHRRRDRPGGQDAADRRRRPRPGDHRPRA